MASPLCSLSNAGRIKTFGELLTKLMVYSNILNKGDVLVNILVLLLCNVC